MQCNLIAVTSFGRIAPHYDALMAGVPYDMWAEYYMLLLARLGDEPKSLLDVCCGTGSVAELLAAEGFELTGVDNSTNMIRVARAKASARALDIKYLCVDAVKLDLAKTFDAAYSFFDSLNYIVSPAQVAESIRHVAEHLKPGGSFVFDLNTAYAFEQRMFDQRDMRRAAEVRYRWSGEYDPKSRIIRVLMEFWVGRERFEEMHEQRAHSDDEVRGWLADAGFADVTAYESYTLQPPGPSSDRVHYVAVLP